MMMPRDSSPLTMFIQISLAIQVSPSAQPLRNLKNSHMGTPGQSGMRNRITAAMPTPETTQRFRPRRAINRG